VSPDLQIVQSIFTRNRGSQGYKGDCIDGILEKDEASEMAGDVTDDSSVATDKQDRDNKGGVTIEDSLNDNQNTIRNKTKITKQVST